MVISGVADAYKGWHDTQAATLSFQRTPPTAAVTVAVAIAKKIRTQNTETGNPTGIQLTGRESTWHVPEVLLSADVNYPGEVQAGDKITGADGVAWVVKAANLESHGTRWRLICTKARVDT